jgi:triosephosphate isomerase
VCHYLLQDAFASTGAHTGETPVALLKDAGVKYAIIGHSERRQKGESNEIVAAKAAAVTKAGMTVIACLGETLAERDAGRTFDVVGAQLAVRARHIAQSLRVNPYCWATVERAQPLGG